MTDDIKRIVQWQKIIGTTKDGDVIDAPVTQPVMGDYWVQVEEIVITAADLLEKLACERDQWKARCEAAERDIEQMLINHDEAFDRYCDSICARKHGERCPDDNAICYGCAHCAKWRGPCEGNGGSK